MVRKWGPCARSGCPVLCDTTYCETHRPAPWAGSDRRSRLPPNWEALRQAVLYRDNYTCQSCAMPADDVDHIINGDDHRMENLAAICRRCHLRKSGHEGGSAQGRYS